MDILLFSERSIWTMIHGIALGGGALLTSFAMLFFLIALRISGDEAGTQLSRETHWFTWLAVANVVLLWLAVIIGTYVTFPPYRATPPEGITDLSAYPRALIRSNPATAWLHSFAMETKEHVPWLAAIIATPVAFVSMRYGSRILSDTSLRSIATTLTGVCVVLVAVATILGTLVNKVAPLH
jgi:hypothetical protein